VIAGLPGTARARVGRRQLLDGGLALGAVPLAPPCSWPGVTRP